MQKSEKIYSYLKSATRWLSLALIATMLSSCSNPAKLAKSGIDLSKAGKHSEAIKTLNKALLKGQDQAWAPDAWLALARSQKATQHLADAQLSARRALDTAKDDTVLIEAALLLAELALLNKDLSEAQTALAKLGDRANGDARKIKLEAELMALTGGKPINASELWGEDAVRMGVGKVDTVLALDPAYFNFVNRYVPKGKDEKILSPDGKRKAWRGLSKTGYYLFVSDADGKNVQRLDKAKNAFQPSWAPDSKRVIYSAMNWATRQRSINVYDLQTKEVKKAFSSRKKMGALSAFSPDGTKIAFTYFGELWMMNANGIGRTLINLKDQIKKTVDDAGLLAWSRDGSALAYQPLGSKEIHIIRFQRKI